MENVLTALLTEKNILPEKVEYAIRHLLSMANNASEGLCRLNTAIELLESYKHDLEQEKV